MRGLGRGGLVALVAFAYFYVFPYYPEIHSANELPRAYLVKALVERRVLYIDEGVARWGATADVSPSGGHLYSNKAPGTSLITAPVYALARAVLRDEPSLGLTIWLGRVVTGIAPTLLLLWVLHGFLARFGIGAHARTLTLAVYALGSMAMPYSLLYLSHQPSAVALALAYVAAQRVFDGRGGQGAMAMAGLAAGLAVLCDYQAAFAAVPLGVLGAVRLTRLGNRARLLRAAMLGTAVPVALLLSYHQLAFGSPWRTGYDASESFAAYHQQGLLGITRLRWTAFSNSMVSADNGLLSFAPYWLWALPGLARMWRRGHRGDAAMMAAVAVVMLLFLSSITFWRGGWQLGPRYVTVMLPFLLAPLGVEIEAALRTDGRGALALVRSVAVVAACSIGVVVYAGSCAQFPHFPERFPNPLVEVTFRLWADGQAAPNPLGMLGVPGPWSLGPYVIAVAAAILGALRGLIGWRVIAAGLALAVAALAAWFLLPHGAAANEAAYQWLRGTMTHSVF